MSGDAIRAMLSTVLKRSAELTAAEAARLGVSVFELECYVEPKYGRTLEYGNTPYQYSDWP